MMDVLVVHPGSGDETSVVAPLGAPLRLRRAGCDGDAGRARALIAAWDGKAAAIGLEDLPARLQLAGVGRVHTEGRRLLDAAAVTPVVDGSGVRAALQRWGVVLADRREPGIFAEKRVLMVPGLNHDGLADALARRARHVRYLDLAVFLGIPAWLPGTGSRRAVERMAAGALDRLSDAAFDRLAFRDGEGGSVPGAERLFRWADVLAGDVRAILRHGPSRLDRKLVVTDRADPAAVEALRTRGASVLVTLVPSLDDGAGCWSAATLEAILAAARRRADQPLAEDTYLDLLADVTWKPGIRYHQPGEQDVNRFAFVIHPLGIGFIHRHPLFAWTRVLPDRLVERVAAHLPPLHLSRITGGRSPATGQRIEGHLLSLGATPREMMRRGERFTYDRLNRAARMAERRGARLMGLGAFTSVVGDAGVTVAHEADIAVTSGNSLTVAATLEAAKQAVIRMGADDLTKGRAMVIGATGSIGSVCARLLAQAIRDVVLVSIEPERLIDLKRRILAETPGARVAIATRSDELVGTCDLVVTATSAFGQRVLDITRCKPGAVVCDVARPPDIGPEEAALRPDVLVVESGEVLIPGDIDFGYDIGLPPKTSYACLAETALLAMEGRFEDYTVGRNITMEQAKEIYQLFRKHGFEIAGLRSFGRYVDDDELAEKRREAERLRSDPELLERTVAEAGRRMAAMPAAAKGVRGAGHVSAKDAAWLAGTLAAALFAARRYLRRG